MTRRVILAGGGHAHLAVLADWAQSPLRDTECWLVTSARHTAYSGMLPGWMAGHYRARDLFIDLKPIAEKAGAKLVLADVVGLDANARSLALSTGELTDFDLLSLATGGETDISSLAALGERLLPVKPVSVFMERWSAFLDRASLRSAVHVVIVGGGAGGVELALSASIALRRLSAHFRISLVTPKENFLEGHAPGVRLRVLAEFRSHRISCHFALAVGEEGGLLLSNGSFLPCECVIAATGSRAPFWLAKSGLACTDKGFVAIGPDLRSASHPAIFAAGDIAQRCDQNVARSGVHAVKGGPVLAANLRAILVKGKMDHYLPRERTLYLLATGNKRAILSWGKYVTGGRLAWRVKDFIDRSFVGRYNETDSQWR